MVLVQSSPTNCVILSGSVSKSGTLGKSGRGVPYSSFHLSFPELTRNAAGEQVWRDSVINCVLFGDRARRYHESLVKGARVCVQGRLHYDKYIDPHSNDRSKHEVWVDRIDFISAAGTDA